MLFVLSTQTNLWAASAAVEAREVKCGAEGQPLVSNFSQRKSMVRKRAGQVSLKGNMRLLDFSSQSTQMPKFVHTDGWVILS